jgi:hypothetical protein
LQEFVTCAQRLLSRGTLEVLIRDGSFWLGDARVCSERADDRLVTELEAAGIRRLLLSPTTRSTSLRDMAEHGVAVFARHGATPAASADTTPARDMLVLT